MKGIGWAISWVKVKVVLMVGLMAVWKDDLTVSWEACRLADRLDAEAVDG